VHLATTIRSPQEARTWLKLHTTSLVFPKETSLEDLFKTIKTATKGRGTDDPPIPVYLDPVGLQIADKTMNSPIQWDVEGVPLATSLPLILKQVGLRFYVMSNGLLIVSAETAEDTPPDPSALILDNLAMLRDEVATLRAEVFALRRGDSPSPKRQFNGAIGAIPAKPPQGRVNAPHAEKLKPKS